ncbi:MAG: cystathionine beta-synthase [Geoglossum simile]|nr:MAG: cystathionine beta-synthase [Geoglossum simile]
MSTPPAPINSITQQIGNTPLVRLNAIPQSLGIEATVYAKLEYFNAGGSVKDRIALRMIEQAEKSGRIKPGDTLIEPTSGNTGIGLALVAAVKGTRTPRTPSRKGSSQIAGYKTIITLPEKMSLEKISVLRALNATIIRTPTQAAYNDPESHISVAKRLEQETQNAHILDQYSNDDNPYAHELGTAEEIWAQTDGKIKAIVAGVGTGGTITGLARGLRKHNPNIKVIGADPHGSILAIPDALNHEHANEGYKVEGIGYDFVPDVLDRQVVDKWYKTEDRESFMYARKLIAEEGLLVGGSSGSAISAMVRGVRDLKLTKGDVVVVILPDSIRSYLSKFADDNWLAANDLLPSPLPMKLYGATVRSLQLQPVTAVSLASPCGDAIETMRNKGFDQLPVLNSNKKLVGLVTLGKLLNWMSRGQADAKTTVEKVMLDFTRLKVVTDPKDTRTMTRQLENGEQNGTIDKRAPSQGRRYVKITMDTPLSVLEQFLEWNSAAVVTEDDGENASDLRPVAVATKVDLVTWLVQGNKIRS